MGASSRLTRDKFRLRAVSFLASRAPNRVRLEKNENRDTPGAQISDEIVSEARKVLRKGR
jgi:hypothetical protein